MESMNSSNLSRSVSVSILGFLFLRSLSNVAIVRGNTISWTAESRARERSPSAEARWCGSTVKYNRRVKLSGDPRVRDTERATRWC